MSTALASTRTSQRRSLSSFSATSTSFSHAIGSIDSSKPAVVIEIGTNLTKCGFAGDKVPRIVRTQFRDELLQVHKNLIDENGTTIQPNIKNIFKFFKYLFYNVLITMPRERRVIIVESVFTPTELRQAICKVLLEILHVPSVLFMPSHLCATFPFNTKNALVLDVGIKESSAIPIAEGVTMLNNWEISKVGYSLLANRVKELMFEFGRIIEIDGNERVLSEEDWQHVVDYDILEEIICRSLFCTSKERSLLIQKGEEALLDPVPVSYEIPIKTESLKVPGIVRETACEVFFDKNSEDDPPLQILLNRLIDKLPIDLRRQMFSGILVTGGVSLIPGFLSRLKEELILCTSEKENKANNVVKFYHFAGQSTSMYLNWLGGSLFGSLQEAVQLRSLTRDQWLSNATVPDWTDYVEHGYQCGKLEV
ncbi:unnamed protein product [Auanema sp. JU1783]|nr:unnamed protein product [Auanema sp. JU1783]